MGRIQILDGGMGTTLEALGHDVSGPMWGSDLLGSKPGVIRNIHHGYVEAGADLVETATYQIALTPDLDPAEIQHRKTLMSTALEIAVEEAGPSNRRVALSIGPYGATLSPGQEYTGVYPLPYGHSSLDDDPQAAEDALTNFHATRLKAYAATKHWSEVCWIAFETIPLLVEVRAIRRAVGLCTGDSTDFWICVPFPDGQFPNGNPKMSKCSIRTVLESMLLPLFSDNSAPPPKGVGINCTHPSHLSHLCEAFSEGIKNLLEEGKIDFRPTLIIYPDGGATYDPVERKWTERGYSPEDWARQVGGIALEMEALEWKGQHVWGGVVIGGCCKTSFAEIKALRYVLNP